MLQIVSRFAIVLILLTLIGCGVNKRTETRTYQLPQGDASWEAITMVLEEEWQRHSVVSRAERRADGVAVKTTPRGHRKIEEAIKIRNK